MIEGLQPYEQYKESGLPWLGRCPKHWVIKRGKSYMTCIDQRSKAGKEELLTVSSARGVIPRNTAKVTMFKAESYAGYKLCWPGDLVINSLWAWGGGLGVAQHHGIISTAYSVYRPRLSAQMNPRFLHELVRSSAFNWELHVRSKGIWISRLQLTDTSFLDAPIPLPSPDEQAAIVHFLDFAKWKCDGFIRAKRKLIALLGEQKQVIIHHAVTRGINPNVSFKPTGIPWLGDIPRHWRVAPLGRLCASRCDGPFGSGLKSAHYVDSGVRVVRLQNIGSGDFRNRAAAFIDPKHYATLGDHSVIAGDLLVAGLGDEKIPAGRACVAPAGIEPAMVKADCFRFRLRDGVAEAEFLAQHLSATAAIATACLSTGATRLRINLSATASRGVALPPRGEQQEIVALIGKTTAPLNAAIARAEREIALMQEFRTRLTADVVTGKLDVRAAAANLPAIPGGSMSNDAADEPPQELEEAESEEFA
jgi:type I restriction enzyme S subunit